MNGCFALDSALRRISADEWSATLAVRFTATTLHEGFLEEDGELWTPDGILVAQSRQLAVALPFY